MSIFIFFFHFPQTNPQAPATPTSAAFTGRRGFSRYENTQLSHKNDFFFKKNPFSFESDPPRLQEREPGLGRVLHRVHRQPVQEAGVPGTMTHIQIFLDTFIYIWEIDRCTTRTWSAPTTSWARPPSTWSTLTSESEFGSPKRVYSAVFLFFQSFECIDFPKTIFLKKLLSSFVFFQLLPFVDIGYTAKK